MENNEGIGKQRVCNKAIKYKDRRAKKRWSKKKGSNIINELSTN